MDRGGKEKAIGIDLGTTYSCVGVWQHDRVEIIANDQGNRTTPSMVAFTPDERIVGDGAKNQISTNPTNTVFDAKRLIGRRYNDPSVQSDKILWHFTIVSGKNDKPLVEVEYKGEKKLFAAEEISALVLMKMKMTADEYLGCDVKNAVITVPAYFNDSQRRATKDAAKIAGLNVMRIINEPTAAAINYVFDGLEREKGNILVFDLGGGTFDVSIVTAVTAVTAERVKQIQVKAVGGDMHLGGQDFDNRMVDYCAKLFNRKTKLDMCTNPKALRRLRTECERAKRDLSTSVETVIDIDSLHEGQDFHTKISRAKFEDLNADLFKKCMQLVKQCMEDSKLRKDEIDDIVLVGGSSRIPKVQQLVSQFFGGKELCKRVHPDEAVAQGAALLAAMLNKETFNIVLEDVTPLSLGVRLTGGVMKVVVPRNTSIPTLKETSVTTKYDNQTSVNFPIYEGERPLAAQNNLLGEFNLKGLKPAQCGEAKITVCFEVDEEGILTASARDKGTGANNQITVTNEHQRLSTKEIDEMVAAAEKYRKEDEEILKKRLAKNTLECYVYNMKSRVTEAKSKGTMKTRVADDIRRALNAAKEWLDENDHATIEEFQAKLNKLSLKCKCLA